MPVKNIVAGQRVAAAKLQAAKQLRRHATPEETILWKALRTNRFRSLHFRRQQVIDGFVVDFYCHLAALVVEVDGPVHERQTEADAERDRALSTRGLKVFRVKNRAVREDLPAVLDRIGQLVALDLPIRSLEGAEP